MCKHGRNSKLKYNIKFYHHAYIIYFIKKVSMFSSNKFHVILYTMVSSLLI